MGRHVDRARLRCAQLDGAVTAIRDTVILDDDRFAALRASWPDLVERLERAIALVEGT